MAKDVEIVIGARDKASKIMEDVGRSAKRLSGNVKQLEMQSQQSATRMQASFAGLKSAAIKLSAAVAAVKTTIAGLRFLSDSSSAYDVQAEAVRGLTNAIKLSGDVAGPTVKAHMRFASALQGVANVGDEVTLGLMRRASMLGVQNDQLQDVIKATIGMSEATGTGLEESLKKTIAAVNGNAGAWQEFIPKLRTATSESEKLAMIQDIARRGLQDSADKALTAEGASIRLSNSWGDLKESVGELLAPLRILIASGLETLVAVIKQRVIPVTQALVKQFSGTGQSISQLKSQTLDFVTKATIGWSNLGSIIELFQAKSALRMEQFREDMKHTFTQRVPAYISWFATNWQTLFQDAGRAAVVAISNAARSIQDIVKVLWESIQNGMQGGFGALSRDIGNILQRNLLDGFEAKTQALPEIAGRALTGREKELQQKVRRLALNLGRSFSEQYTQIVGAANGNANVLDLKLPEIPAAQQQAIQNKLLGNLGITRLSSQATQLNSVESRLLTRGRTQNPAEETNELLKKLIKFVKEVVTNTETSESSDSLRVEVVS